MILSFSAIPKTREKTQSRKKLPIPINLGLIPNNV